MDVKLFNEIFDGQYDKNFTNIMKFMQRNCSQAKNVLTSWNKKDTGDAYKYAVSIVSTVGKYTVSIVSTVGKYTVSNVSTVGKYAVSIVSTVGKYAVSIGKIVITDHPS